MDRATELPECQIFEGALPGQVVAASAASAGVVYVVVDRSKPNWELHQRAVVHEAMERAHAKAGHPMAPA